MVTALMDYVAQEQLLEQRGPGDEWMRDVCDAILDTSNTSMHMSLRLLELSCACLRSLSLQIATQPPGTPPRRHAG